MDENLSEIEVVILELWYELGINKLIEEAIIFDRLSTKFYRNDVDRYIHKLMKDVMISCVFDLPNQTRRLYRLTDERGKPYIKEKHGL